MDYQGIDKCLPAALAEELRGIGDVQIEELSACGRAGPPWCIRTGRYAFCPYTCTKDEIEEIVLGLSGHSLHSYSEDIKNSFFSVDGGVRIGLGGRVVTKGGDIHMMRGFTSINIRFPREIRGFKKAHALCGKRTTALSLPSLSPPPSTARPRFFGTWFGRFRRKGWWRRSAP